MNKRDLEELIWNTRRDFFEYLTEHRLTVRSIEEAHLVNQYHYKHIGELGFNTLADIIQEKNKLEKQLETLKETIKLLSNKQGEIEE